LLHWREAYKVCTDARLDWRKLRDASGANELSGLNPVFGIVRENVMPPCECASRISSSHVIARESTAELGVSMQVERACERRECAIVGPRALFEQRKKMHHEQRIEVRGCVDTVIPRHVGIDSARLIEQL
jgi:hypothetical protein